MDPVAIGLMSISAAAHRQNQMHEALMLFDSICNSQWFLKTNMASVLV